MTLKELREINKLTQTDVAEILKIHRTTLARIEKGYSSLKAEQIDSLATLYKIEPELLYKIYYQCRQKRQEVKR